MTPVSGNSFSREARSGSFESNIDTFLPVMPRVRVLGLEVRVADLFLEISKVGSSLYADRRPPSGLTRDSNLIVPQRDHRSLSGSLPVHLKSSSRTDFPIS